MTFDEWIKLGYDEGFCSPPVCSTHDGVPTTATEDEEWDLLEFFEEMDVYPSDSEDFDDDEDSDWNEEEW